MKKIVFIAFAMFLGFGLRAQTLTVSYNNDPVADNDTLSLKPEDDEFEFKPFFTNNGTQSIVARIRVDQLNETPTHVWSICTGQLCVSGTQSAPFTLTAGMTYADAHIDFTVPEDAPMGLFKVTVFDTNSPNTKAEFFVKMYNKNAVVGICDVADEASFIAYPNPATSAVNVDYSLKSSTGELRLYNMAGVCVKSLALTEREGCVRMDLSGLPTGVYMYGLCDGQRTSGMKKLVVK